MFSKIKHLINTVRLLLRDVLREYEKRIFVNK